MKWLTLLEKVVDEFARKYRWETWNVVDGLLWIDLGALTARNWEVVDEVTLPFEEARFEDGEQSARTSTDNDNIGLVHCRRLIVIHDEVEDDDEC
jgi:hypothetical protein